MTINLVLIPMIPNLMPHFGLVGSILHILCTNFVAIVAIGWYALFHLSYYSLSYRISILSSLIARPDQHAEGGLDGPSSQQLKRMRTCGYLFDQICQVSNDINSAFSLSILTILTIMMIDCSTALFFCLYSLTTLFKGMFYGFLTFFANCVCLILVIVISTHSPIAEVQNILNF